MRKILILDTSVFMNILDIPRFNQHRNEVMAEFQAETKLLSSFYIPYGTILETGNHIAQIKKPHSILMFAEKFKKTLMGILNGEAESWAIIGDSPDRKKIIQLLEDFPFKAQAGIGWVDATIIKEFEEQRLGSQSVKIWSIDKHLKGYES